MTIREYADDVNKSVDEIIKHMERLAMDFSDLDRVLSDDEIILLDNSLQDEEDYVDTLVDEELEKNIMLDEKAEKIAYDNSYQKEEKVKSTNKEKKKAKNTIKNNLKKDEFKKERKNIYKHKEKLQSNEQVVDNNVLLYKDGMSVKDLADILGVTTGEIIMKLMGLGIMATVNNSLSFEDVEVLALDYNKTVKREESAYISNFENY